jgi:hypothetical protein
MQVYYPFSAGMAASARYWDGVWVSVAIASTTT